MSLLGKRQVAVRFKKKYSNHAQNTTPIPRVLYNPYKRKLFVSRKKLEHVRTPQFKMGKKFENTSEWFGDTMDEFPAVTHTRFVLQNCNGLSTSSDRNFFKSNMTEIVSKDIHFLALPEINVNCINVNITNGYKEAFVNITNNGVFNATNTPIFDSNIKYQPGGVASGFFGQLTTRYIKHSKDKYGRWHSHEFQGKERNLRVYTLYRVNYSTDQTT